MTDPTPAPAPVAVGAPIMVAGPATEQAQALLRQTLLAAGLVVAAFGLAKEAGVLNLLASLAGPIATVVSGAVGLGALAWGQWKTRLSAQQRVAMARALPDEIAQVKS